jgi:hypothetical protein
MHILLTLFHNQYEGDEMNYDKTEWACSNRGRRRGEEIFVNICC